MNSSLFIKLHLLSQIVAQSIKGNKTLANVLIKLIDINDNYPKFEQAEFVANISEDSCQDEITTIEVIYKTFSIVNT